MSTASRKPGLTVMPAVLVIIAVVLLVAGVSGAAAATHHTYGKHGKPDVSDLKHTHREVKVSGSKPVRLEIEFDAGHLRVTPGGSNGTVVLDLYQSANADTPMIELEKVGGHDRLRVASGEWNFEEGGHIHIHHSSSNRDDDGEEKDDDDALDRDHHSSNHDDDAEDDDDDDDDDEDEEVRRVWEISLPSNVPFDLVLASGASTSDLDLTGIRVHDLHLATGAGDMEVRFDAENPSPGGTFEIQGGACKFIARGLGNARFRSVTFSGGVGDFLLDFAGKPREDMKAELDLGLGKLRVEIPPSLGVKLDTSGASLAHMDVEGLEQQGDAYVSPGYARASQHLTLDIAASLGIVEVAVED